MAIHVRTTAGLLSATRQRLPLLGRGSSRQLGPVSAAIRTMRQAEAEDAAIEAIQHGLDAFFAEAGIAVDLDAALRTAGGAA